MGSVRNCSRTNYRNSYAIPETKKGLKFDAAAKELKIISDEFFKLRNHNPEYKRGNKRNQR